MAPFDGRNANMGIKNKRNIQFINGRFRKISRNDIYLINTKLNIYNGMGATLIN